MAIKEVLYQGNIWIRRYQPYVSSYEAPLYKYNAKKNTMVMYPDNDPIYTHTAFSHAISHEQIDVSPQTITTADGGLYRQIIFDPYNHDIEGTYISEYCLYSQDKDGKRTKLHSNGQD